MTHELEVGTPPDSQDSLANGAYLLALTIATIVRDEDIRVCVALGESEIARAIECCIQGRADGYVAITVDDAIGYQTLARTRELGELLRDVVARAAARLRPEDELS